MSENVEHPAHYGGEDNDYEVIKVLEAWDLDLAKGFCWGSLLKYTARAGKKGSEVEDRRKAEWYANRLVTITATLAERWHNRPPTESEKTLLKERAKEQVDAIPLPVLSELLKNQADPAHWQAPLPDSYWQWSLMDEYPAQYVVQVVTPCTKSGDVEIMVVEGPPIGAGGVALGTKLTVGKTFFDAHAKYLQRYTPPPAVPATGGHPGVGSRWKVGGFSVFAGPILDSGAVRLFENTAPHPSTWTYSQDQFWKCVEKGTIIREG
jgi:hypothetical protein